VEFDASASYDPDQGSIERYYWNFDDGTGQYSTQAKTLHHIYQQAGSYSVKLKVVDNDGGVDSTITTIPTNNQAPVAMLQVQPVSGEAPLTIHYTATNSVDPDGKIVDYRIDFDDGTSALDSAGSHIYNTDKDYRVILTVQDNLGQTDTAQVFVKVATPPVAILKVSPIEGPFPLDCRIDGTDSYDPQGGKIEHDIYIDGDLKYSNVDSVVHNFDAPDKYQVKLIVTSKRNGLTDQKQQSVTVTNFNPKADFVWQPTNPQPRTEVTYTSTSSDSNSTDYISHYKWTFPDGNIIEGDNDAIVKYIFSLDYTPYTVKLEVWDTFNGYGSVVKTISK
jgi:PKD repeat protein